jgi:hypothetical protein
MINKSMNPYQTQDLQALKTRAGAKISSAIETASTKTGMDFSYLLQQASVESSFNPKAKARTSSATGLYQFIDSTWMEMVRDHGHKYGLSRLANQIDEKGEVANRSDRQQILALRKDPLLASYMAAEYASDNKQHLEQKVGGQVGSTELYLAHFMGPNGASRFLNELRENPQATAARVFPREATSNRNVFYNQNGGARSLSEVYAFFDSKFRIDGTFSSPNTQIAQVNNPVYGRVDQFNEKTERWVKTSRPEDLRAHLLLMAQLDRQNSNAALSLAQLSRNPVDKMTLLDLISTDHNDQNRYNA